MSDDRTNFWGALAVVGFLVAAIADVAGVVALPMSWNLLRALFIALLIGGLAVVAVFAIRWKITSPARELARLQRCVHDRDATIDSLQQRVVTYQKTLWDVSDRHKHHLSEAQEYWLYIGADDAGDKVHEVFETTAVDDQGLLWRGIDEGSQNMAKALSGLVSISRCNAIAQVTPAGQRDVKLVEAQYDVRRLSALAIFTPALAKDESVTWSFDYDAHATWSDLRRTGNDMYEVQIGVNIPSLQVYFTFARLEPTASCVVEMLPKGPAHAALPAVCTKTDTGGRTRFEWLAQRPPAGVYRFSLRLGRVSTAATPQNP